jgi:hypothetical protein
VIGRSDTSTHASTGDVHAPSTGSAHPSSADWRYGIGIAVASRLILLSVAYGTHWLLSTGRGVAQGLSLGIWQRWDANVLLNIALHGYSTRADPHPTAFFPMFPLLVRAVTFTGVSAVAAGLLVNAAASAVAFAYLSQLARRDLGSGEAGRRAVLYLAFFPTALFLVAPYTEAVFLAGAIAAFSYARSGRWGFAALPAAVAVGDRFLGLAVLAGLGVEFLRQRDFRPRRVGIALAALAVGALPFVAYAAYLWHIRGSPWYFVTDERLGWGRSYVGFLKSFETTLSRATSTGNPSGLVLATRIEVLAAAAGVVFTGWAVARREYGYAVFLGMTMAALMTSSWYVSIPRTLLSLFPIPIFLAGWVQRHRHAHDLLFAASVAVAALGTVVFTRGFWFF